ncbi:hypothetical protein E3J51_02930 [Candidatus Bathyarchaeota archaeon]|nr:MAG: hypothetical protein E3J51_02930 [Candidatus Bathyarchaeota archaeon]
MRKHEDAHKYCGNCYFHGVYDFPDRTFCMLRFKRREEPVVPTLGVCESWKPDYQGCHCVREAVKRAKSKRLPQLSRSL